MDPNVIQGRLAFGKKEGILYTPISEGLITLTGGNLDATLDAPYQDGDYSLGRRMKDYQHAILELEKGEKLSDSDLDFICFKLGIEVEQEGNLKDCNVILSPFEMKLRLDTIDLRDGRNFQIDRTYIAKDVKAGIFGFSKEVGVKYKLIPKKE